MNIVIIGKGHFGAALAQIYESHGHTVFTIDSRRSPGSLSAQVIGKSVMILCVPTQEIPKMLAQRGDLLLPSRAIVSTAKGLLRDSGQTPLHYIAKVLKRRSPPLFVLSGPSFAAELVRGQPTALVLAGKNPKGVDFLSQKLSTSQLRLYKNHDPLGVELCGALKNVYALASGMVEGLGFGDNTRAALNTRALAEMSRIGRALGGNPLTFFGLAGVGDLFLTCSSRQSRNYQFGLGFVRGKSSEDLLKELGTVEGLWTAAVARALCKKKNLQAPLISTIASILERKLTPQEALTQLMSRKVRHEFD